MSQWANRTVGHAEVPPGDLAANPRNWRIHPQHQQDALTDVLDRVGWVQDVLVNKRTGFVVDGHLRVALAIARDEATVPVKYIDLSPDEEALVLATLDPIASLAEEGRGELDALIAELGEADEEAARIAREIAEGAYGASGSTGDGDAAPPDGFASFDEDIETDYRCPKCSYEWSGNPKQ